MENFFNHYLLPPLDSVDAWVMGHGLDAVGGLLVVFAAILGFVVWYGRSVRRQLQAQLDTKIAELNDLNEQHQLQQHDARVLQQQNHQLELQLGVLDARKTALDERLDSLSALHEQQQAQLENSRRAEQQRDRDRG